jgi:hypothetical protein
MESGEGEKTREGWGMAIDGSSLFSLSSRCLFSYISPLFSQQSVEANVSMHIHTYTHHIINMHVI